MSLKCYIDKIEFKSRKHQLSTTPRVTVKSTGSPKVYTGSPKHDIKEKRQIKQNKRLIKMSTQTMFKSRIDTRGSICVPKSIQEAGYPKGQDVLVILKKTRRTKKKPEAKNK